MFRFHVDLLPSLFIKCRILKSCIIIVKLSISLINLYFLLSTYIFMCFVSSKNFVWNHVFSDVTLVIAVFFHYYFHCIILYPSYTFLVQFFYFQPMFVFKFKFKSSIYLLHLVYNWLNLKFKFILAIFAI